MPDLLNLPIVALFSYLLLVAAIDVGFAIVMAVVHGDFSAAYVADFLRTHILLRVFVIGALGILGHGIAVLQVPAIPAVSAAASAGLLAYIVETVASLRGSLTSTVPVPTPPTPTPEG